MGTFKNQDIITIVNTRSEMLLAIAQKWQIAAFVVHRRFIIIKKASNEIKMLPFCRSHTDVVSCDLSDGESEDKILFYAYEPDDDVFGSRSTNLIISSTK